MGFVSRLLLTGPRIFDINRRTSLSRAHLMCVHWSHFACRLLLVRDYQDATIAGEAIDMLVWCDKVRKPTVRFGSIRFLHEPVPVLTVPVPNPVPPVPVRSGSDIFHGFRSQLTQERNIQGCFFWTPKNAQKRSPNPQNQKRPKLM